MAPVAAGPRLDAPIQIQPVLRLPGAPRGRIRQRAREGRPPDKDEVETQYAFESLDKLLEDFEADVEALRREEGEGG